MIDENGIIELAIKWWGEHGTLQATQPFSLWKPWAVQSFVEGFIAATMSPGVPVAPDRIVKGHLRAHPEDQPEDPEVENGLFWRRHGFVDGWRFGRSQVRVRKP